MDHKKRKSAIDALASISCPSDQERRGIASPAAASSWARPWVERHTDDSEIQPGRMSDKDAWPRRRLSAKRKRKREAPAAWVDDRQDQTPRPEHRLWRNRRRRKRKSKKYDDGADNRATPSMKLMRKKIDGGEKDGGPGGRGAR